ncbi:MAG: hypothetical protein O3B47_00310 [bacterium]|nr:hypothetical protein [bacterium]
MKILNNVFVSLITALFTMFFVYGGYTIYAEGDEPEVYSFKSYKVDETRPYDYYWVFDKYHQTMNDTFNDYLSKLNKYLEDADFYKKHKANLYPPANIDFDKDDLATILQKCGKENVSTYCVSMKGLDIYTQYIDVLKDMKSSLAVIDFSKFDASYLIARTTGKNEEIAMEIKKSKQTLEGAVGLYNEYRLAYPLHKKYEEIKKELIKYKKKLRDIRLEAMWLPAKFIDSTSDQCN